MVFHIRNKLKTAKGNQFYKDKSFRGRGTVCGAECGHYDIPWGDRNRKSAHSWNHNEHGKMEVCELCLRLVQKGQ